VPDLDLIAVLSRVVAGDRLAFAQATRFVNGFLVRWNAYDFRDEWEDIVQEVVTAAALAVRRGELRDPQAIAAFLKTTTRFRYLDRLRVLLGQRKGARLALEERIDAVDSSRDLELRSETRDALRRALARIPEKKRELLMAVYGIGQTYEEAAQSSGIPLGTLKRYLRDGLAELRDSLAEPSDEK